MITIYKCSHSVWFSRIAAACLTQSTNTAQQAAHKYAPRPNFATRLIAYESVLLIQQELDAEIDAEGARQLLAVRARAHLRTVLGYLQ